MSTKSKYEKRLQDEINKIARYIDRFHICISGYKTLYPGEYDAGHFYSVGSNPSLRFNLHNIFGQSVSQNRYEHGNQTKYAERLGEIFGPEYREEVESLRVKYKLIKLSIPELKEAIKKAKDFFKRLEKQEINRYSRMQRIEIRREANLCIGIYSE